MSSAIARNPIPALPELADWVIYQVGVSTGNVSTPNPTAYAARNTQTGQILTNTALDIGALLNAVFALVGTGTANIVVKEGTYIYSTTAVAGTLTTPGGISLIGAGRNRTYFKPSTTALTFINIGNGASTQTYVWYFAHYKIFNSNSTITGTGMNFAANAGTAVVAEAVIEDVEVRDLTTNGITGYLRAGYSRVSGCWFDNSASLNLFIQSTYPTAETFHCTENVFSGTGVTLTGSGIVYSDNYHYLSPLIYTAGAVGSTGDGPIIVISGNIWLVNSSTAITLTALAGTAVGVGSEVIVGNVFYNPAAVNFTWLNVGAYHTNLYVAGNTIAANAKTLTTVYGSNLTQVVVVDNPGYNPINSITNMFNTTNNTIGIAGSTATPIAATDYVVMGAPLTITSTGGTNQSISTKDGAGNVIQSGQSTITALRLPVGWKINFGSFSGAPTVTVWGE